MRVLVTGASGMLGSEIVPLLEKRGDEVRRTDADPREGRVTPMRVEDGRAVRKVIGKFAPELVFHLAAETDVDLCELRPGHAHSVNVKGTENVASACAAESCAMVYISTGMVFGGDKDGPYTEDDEPAPLSVYGRSKLEGEEKVRELVGRHYIVRAGWMVGGWDRDRKFVSKIVKKILRGERTIPAVHDRYGSPTFTADLARTLMSLLDTGSCGLYHAVNSGACSRYDMALKIAEFMDADEDVEVKPVSIDEFSLPAPRGRSEIMANHRLGLLGMDNMPRWQDSLEDYIRSNLGKGL